MPLLLGLLLGLGGTLPAEPAVLTSPSSLVYPDFWHTPLGLHRGNPKLLKLMVGDKAHFDDPAGVACTRMLEHGEQSPQITAFGVNSAAGQIIYNPDMTSLKVYGQTGAGDERFMQPVGIACLPDGRVAVADAGNNRIVQLLFAQGRLHWGGSFGTRGKGPGQFENPRWVAFDSQGRYYVSDTGNNRVQVFDPDGGYLFSFGQDQSNEDSLMAPQAIAVVDPHERYSATPYGAIFVVDQYHGRIQEFDLQGHFLAQALPADMGKALAYFDGIALDYFNNLWVADRGNNQIHKFDQYLQYIDTWGSFGQGDGYLDSPRGLAIYRHYGQVLVLEKEEAQYFWIGADIKDVKFSKQDDSSDVKLRIDYRLTEQALVDCWVETLDQEKLLTLTDKKLTSQGPQTLLWDGNLLSGYRIPPGTYYLVFQAEASYSSATYFKRETRKRFVVH
jgi:DNA-binding beta-propeller fold protein YncE